MERRRLLLLLLSLTAAAGQVPKARPQFSAPLKNNPIPPELNTHSHPAGLYSVFSLPLPSSSCSSFPKLAVPLSLYLSLSLVLAFDTHLDSATLSKQRCAHNSQPARPTSFDILQKTDSDCCSISSTRCGMYSTMANPSQLQRAQQGTNKMERYLHCGLGAS